MSIFFDSKEQTVGGEFHSNHRSVRVFHFYVFFYSYILPRIEKTCSRKREAGEPAQRHAETRSRGPESGKETIQTVRYRPEDRSDAPVLVGKGQSGIPLFFLILSDE